MIIDKTYLFSREFKNLSFRSQAVIVCENLDLIQTFQPRAIAYLTTSILRADCGCKFERYYDELSEKWIEIEEHGNGCLRVRYPIIEDLNDSTLLRRSRKEVHLDSLGFQQMEEGLYAPD